MSNQKNDNGLLAKQLKDLIDIVGDSCGPLLIKELQKRIDQTVERFNKDVDVLSQDSFKGYSDRVDFCKKIISETKKQ